jgi:hypothetical protein
MMQFNVFMVVLIYAVVVSAFPLFAYVRRASCCPPDIALTQLDLYSRQGDPTAPPACAAQAHKQSRMRLSRRIAQDDLGTVAQSWKDLCLKSGGNITSTAQPCLNLADIDGLNALLANADPCAQQVSKGVHIPCIPCR